MAPWPVLAQHGANGRAYLYGGKVAVKNTFIDCYDPPPEQGLRRSRSDSALLLPHAAAEAFGRICPPGVAFSHDHGPALLAASGPETPPRALRSPAQPRRPRGEEPRASGAFAAEGAAAPQARAASPLGAERRTTVMLRNLPKQITRSRLTDLLELFGLGGQYDVVYVPMDFEREQSLGYGFVNFVSPDAAFLCFQTFHGLDEWEWTCSKVCQVQWGEVQGFDANVDHYRNSPAMHPDVPARFKPTIYSDGRLVEFPPPTRELKPPRLRRGHRLVK